MKTVTRLTIWLSSIALLVLSFPVYAQQLTPQSTTTATATIQEWVMTNWEVISLIINAILTVLILRQRTRLKETETTATAAQADAVRVEKQAESDLEEIRNQGKQNLAIIELLRGQIANQGRLANAMEARNQIDRTNSEQHAKVVDGVLKSNDLVVELINNFQTFSANQHTATRTEVGSKVDNVASSLLEARADLAQFRKDMNGHFKRLEPSLQRLFESSERKLDAALQKLPETGELDASKVPPADPAGGSETAA